MTLLQHALRSSALALCGVCGLASSIAIAGEGAATEKAILILDASGSMWGQVDGTHKITIARDVIDGLLDEWNPKVELGLSAYGHREKGNCADIETLAPVGPVDKPSLMAAIEGLNPKGKTPLTDAVRLAAEALRYTEERATVILVSDGKETCEADPCAVAAELDAAGVDFTAHVVGFDLTEEEKAQLQCIADNTGGRFLSAGNAPELHEAMVTTVQLVAEPKTAPQRIVRIETPSIGRLSIVNIAEKVMVQEPDGTLVTWVDPKRDLPVELKAGSYRLATQEQDLTEFDVKAGEDVVVDGNQLVGWLSIEGMTEKVMVQEPDGTLVTWVDPKRDLSIELRAGAYRLATQEQNLTEFDVIAGKDIVVDGSQLVGWLSIEGMTENLVVRNVDDSLVTWVNAASDRPVELKAGAYKLGTLRDDLTQFKVVAGEELVIELAH